MLDPEALFDVGVGLAVLWSKPASRAAVDVQHLAGLNGQPDVAELGQDQTTGLSQTGTGVNSSLRVSLVFLWGYVLYGAIVLLKHGFGGCAGG